MQVLGHIPEASTSDRELALDWESLGRWVREGVGVSLARALSHATNEDAPPTRCRAAVPAEFDHE